MRRLLSPIVINLPRATLTESDRTLLREERPAGVILFRRNLRSMEQLFELTHDIRRELGSKAAIAIDQEGGAVDRLQAIGPKSPSAQVIARQGPASCRLAGLLTGEILGRLGINWNMAPCLDLALHKRSKNGIGDRGFHRFPERVISFAKPYLSGLERSGAAGCLKHFPGHGRAPVDSHEDLPIIKARSAILERDIAPFAALRNRHRPVMISHCVYPALDRNRLPASLSPAIIAELLRKRLRHQGPVVTDDIEMKAIRNRFGIREACERTLDAGADLILVCRSRQAVRKALEVTRNRCSERVARFQKRLMPPPRRYDAAAIRKLFSRLAALNDGDAG